MELSTAEYLQNKAVKEGECDQKEVSANLPWCSPQRQVYLDVAKYQFHNFEEFDKSGSWSWTSVSVRVISKKGREICQCDSFDADWRGTPL